MASRVLVTGASGFIGKHLVASLRAAGNEVLVTQRADGRMAAAEYWQTIPDVDHVFHLAARSYVPDSWEDPAAFVEANVGLTARVLEFCRRSKASLTYASAYVYGMPASLPIRESDRVAPNNPYAMTKRMGEELCEFYAQHYGVAAIAARIFNVYGPGQRRDFLIPTLIGQVLAASGEIRVKDLLPRRDYVYVDDVVAALQASMRALPGFNPVNIGSGVSCSVAELIDEIQRAAGVSLPVVCAEAPRVNEIPDVRADIASAQRLLGWQPRVALRDGVARLLRLEREQ